MPVVRKEWARYVALAASAIVLVLTLYVWLGFDTPRQLSASSQYPSESESTSSGGTVPSQSVSRPSHCSVAPGKTLPVHRANICQDGWLALESEP